MPTIVIDSNDRVDGTNTNFSVLLTQEITEVSQCTLKFCNLPVPADNTHSHFLIQINELPVEVRGSNTLSYGSFCIPIVTGGGFRNIFQESNDFKQIVSIPNVAIDRLNVRIANRLGETVSDSGDVLLVLHFE
jgi:hypothetical protein